jgi:TPP-dependent pyruvate/acetoin dehydrogenase alpha subunit
VNAEIDAAIRQAAADPAPDPANLYDNVYGDPNWREQFAPMARGGPFGEREGTRSWRA